MEIVPAGIEIESMASVPPLFMVIALLVPKVREALVVVEVSVFCGLSTPSTAVMVQVEVKFETSLLELVISW